MKKYANEVAGLMNTDHQDIYLDDSSAFDVIQKIYIIFTLNLFQTLRKYQQLYCLSLQKKKYSYL